jgi:peptidoglycan/xylan/chitin deacetylase (PgdA/CDA1 family)
LIGRLIGAGAAAGVVAHAGPALTPLVPGLGSRLGIVQRQDGVEGVALTFDDGPHPQGTPIVLEILREAGAKATFFLAGEQVGRRPALAAEIAAAGHGVELHCHRHRNALRLSGRQFIEDAERGRATIEEATGREVGAHRPPYGIYSAAALRACRRRGWRPVLWSKWGRDWRGRATARSISRLATESVGDGDIVLLHDSDCYSAPGSWTRTAAALPIVLEELGRRGLKAASLRL